MAVTAGLGPRRRGRLAVGGGGVAGTVTDAGAHPLGSVSVDVYTAAGSQVGFALTGSDGTYTVTGLATGSYDVCFTGSFATGGTSTTGYLDQCYDGVAWDGNSYASPGPRRRR